MKSLLLLCLSLVLSTPANAGEAPPVKNFKEQFFPESLKSAVDKITKDTDDSKKSASDENNPYLELLKRISDQNPALVTQQLIDTIKQISPEQAEKANEQMKKCDSCDAVLLLSSLKRAAKSEAQIAREERAEYRHARAEESRLRRRGKILLDEISDNIDHDEISNGKDAIMKRRDKAQVQAILRLGKYGEIEANTLKAKLDELAEIGIELRSLEFPELQLSKVGEKLDTDLKFETRDFIITARNKLETIIEHPSYWVAEVYEKNLKTASAAFSFDPTADHAATKKEEDPIGDVDNLFPVFLEKIKKQNPILTPEVLEQSKRATEILDSVMEKKSCPDNYFNHRTLEMIERIDLQNMAR